MIGAAKKKNLSLLSLAFVRVLPLLVVTLFLPQTRVWGFEAPPQPASGQIASASASTVVGNYDARLYDASDCLVAPKSEIGSNVNITNSGNAGGTNPILKVQGVNGASGLTVGDFLGQAQYNKRRVKFKQPMEFRFSGMWQNQKLRMPLSLCWRIRDLIKSKSFTHLKNQETKCGNPYT